MNGTERNRLRALLLAKEAELVNALRRREGIAVEKTAEEMEEGQWAAEREVAVSNLHRDSGLLRRVRAALRRLGEDSFGICTGCENEISSRRLEALPWAHLCIHCQEVCDREEAAGRKQPEQLLTDAA